MTPAPLPPVATTLDFDGLEQGEMYRVVFTEGRRPKEMTARFMGAGSRMVLYFDLRPLAGTQRILTNSVTAVYKTTASQPVRTRPAASETRVF